MSGLLYYLRICFLIPYIDYEVILCRPGFDLTMSRVRVYIYPCSFEVISSMDYKFTYKNFEF